MATNEIPPMTDPLGRYWDQPNVSEVLIDDTHALVSRSAFDKLNQYDTSIPSGVYPGKMWKCRQRGVMYLRWYGLADDPNFCSNHHRILLVV